MEKFAICRRAIMRARIPAAALAGAIWLAASDPPGARLPVADAASASPPQPLALAPPAPAAASTAGPPDGVYDSAVSNLTTGEGPFPLACEKEGDEITVSFLDGDHFTVDGDGYAARDAEQWTVELDPESHRPLQ
ncbi:hypothetical protein ACT80S_02685 [Ramlibacter sp. MAHUQ-53]|uniref:hypothetical protein n=1 Tax=unclassified Ramlibacter TaxID=2617605 RepID=UPI003630532D